MKKPDYWNHNTAYYGWIGEQLRGCTEILDVGCGDGELCRCLVEKDRRVTGIDPFPACIREAEKAGSDASIRYQTTGWEEYAPDGTFDGITFVASLHHMDMIPALQKAKTLLTPGGKLIVVGLAKPSSAADRIIEVLRVVPSAVSSKLHRIRTCEDANVPVSFAFPAMDDVRAVIRSMLPGAKLRRGLHYRYLLTWEKE